MKICKDSDLVYVPNDSLYIYLKEGYWKPIDFKYIENEAMKMLGKAARSAHCTDIRGLVERASIIEFGQEFNNHNGHINLKNGMLDLDTRKLGAHNKTYYSTIQVQVAYQIGASCPRWLRFLHEVFDADSQRIDAVQEFMGYSLVPDTRYEKAMLLVGEGANGKSTLIRVWEELVGLQNLSRVSMENLQNEFHRVTLQGKLLNISAELNPKAVSKSEYFKSIISGDLIDASHKNKPVFTFRPHARLVFAMNRIPRVQDTSYGFYRRLLIVPFERTFEGTEADRTLANKLTTELDGIFCWALEGLDRLLTEDSFTIPEVSEEMLAEYKRINNPLLPFVQERCSLDTSRSMAKDDLYEEYKKYCENYGYHALAYGNFFKELYAQYPTLNPGRLGPRADRGQYVKGIFTSKTL